MVVAKCMASPRIFCRSLARESIESLPPNTCSVGSGVSTGLVGSCKLASIALAVAIASEVGECESISTCAFHAARVCGAIEYLNVGTLGVLAFVTNGLAGGMSRGSETFPRTPLWLRNDVAIVWVGSL